jgi:hypothetical protein
MPAAFALAFESRSRRAIQIRPAVKGFLAFALPFDKRVERAARALMRRNSNDFALRAAQGMFALTNPCAIAARQ